MFQRGPIIAKKDLMANVKSSTWAQIAWRNWPAICGLTCLLPPTHDLVPNFDTKSLDKTHV